MSSSKVTISKDEAIWAVRNGREHESQLQMDIPDFVCGRPKPVKAESMIRGIRSAASMTTRIQSEGPRTLRWLIHAKAKSSTLTWPLYCFAGPSIEHVRAAMFAESEAKELSAVAKKVKSGSRKLIDD